MRFSGASGSGGGKNLSGGLPHSGHGNAGSLYDVRRLWRGNYSGAGGAGTGGLSADAGRVDQQPGLFVAAHQFAQLCGDNGKTKAASIGLRF